MMILGLVLLLFAVITLCSSLFQLPSVARPSLKRARPLDDEIVAGQDSEFSQRAVRWYYIYRVLGYGYQGLHQSLLVLFPA